MFGQCKDCMYGRVKYSCSLVFTEGRCFLRLFIHLWFSLLVGDLYDIHRWYLANSHPRFMWRTDHYHEYTGFIQAKHFTGSFGFPSMSQPVVSDYLDYQVLQVCDTKTNEPYWQALCRPSIIILTHPYSELIKKQRLKTQMFIKHSNEHHHTLCHNTTSTPPARCLCGRRFAKSARNPHHSYFQRPIIPCFVLILFCSSGLAQHPVVGIILNTLGKLLHSTAGGLGHSKAKPTVCFRVAIVEELIRVFHITSIVVILDSALFLSAWICTGAMIG